MISDKIKILVYSNKSLSWGCTQGVISITARNFELEVETNIQSVFFKLNIRLRQNNNKPYRYKC